MSRKAPSLIQGFDKFYFYINSLVVHYPINVAQVNCEKSERLAKRYTAIERNRDRNRGRQTQKDRALGLSLLLWSSE